MTRPITARVSVPALRHNLATVRRSLGRRFVWAVVKANAYGHGLAPAVSAFADADGLALLEVSEAARARRLGWRGRLLLLEGFFGRDELPELVRHDIEAVVHDQWQIDLLREAAPEGPVRVHLKVNTGMNRLGFEPARAASALAQLRRLPGCRVESVVTHLANAEPSVPADAPVSVDFQLRRLALGDYGELPRCVANSAASLRRAAQVEGPARPGIALYGITPDPRVSAAELGLRPAMTLSSEIIAIRDLAPGEAVGYGSLWRASRPARVAVVACGYADGYPRSAPAGTPVWLAGRRVPLAGRVSMDMLTVDVSDAPEARVGDPVELWGERVEITEVATAAGTIGHELVCALAPRVPVTVSED